MGLLVLMKATIVSLLFILLFQLYPKIRTRWSLPPSTAAAAAASTNSNINPKLASEIVSNLDLKTLIHDLDDKNNGELWDTVIDRRGSLFAYRAQSCQPKDGPLKYLSVTTFENCSAERLRDFYMDNEFRKKWDKTLVDHEQLQVDESNGTEIGRMVKKFPLLTAREYVLAWRVWESKDGSFYCLSKECEHPLAPRKKKYVRVKFFRSGWCIRQVPGRNASEIRMVHQEDAGLNVEMAKLAFSKGIWSYVSKMDGALRKYLATYIPQSSSAVTAVTLIQKVPTELDTLPNVSGPSNVEGNATSVSICQGADKDGKKKSLCKRPSSKLVANGLLVLGGVICMSRGHSSLGAKVAMAYILTKLSKQNSALSTKPK